MCCKYVFPSDKEVVIKSNPRFDIKILTWFTEKKNSKLNNNILSLLRVYRKQIEETWMRNESI